MRSRKLVIWLVLLGLPAVVMASLHEAGLVSTGAYVAAAIAQFAGTVVIIAISLSGSRVHFDHYFQEGALVLIVFVAISVSSAVAPQRASQNFFSVAAQVIPVLLLALAVELRAFRVPWLFRLNADGRLRPTDFGDILRSIALLSTLLLLAVGELEALDVLATPHTGHLYAKNVFSAVLVGLVLVCFFAMSGPMNDDDYPRVAENRPQT